ncbi:MAG: hypothetical protein JSS50_01710 [Proteobacteria bacterium]|nr:hypothetical protein [Pseudomonadota bacterium]
MNKVVFSTSALTQIAHRLWPHSKIEVRPNGEVRVRNNGSISLSREEGYYNFEDGEGSSIPELIRKRTNSEWPAVFDYIHSLEGIAAAPHTQDSQKASDTTNLAERIDKAQKIWNQSKSIIGTIGEQYFHKRHITVPIPETLRFVPKLYNHKADREHPAIVTAIQSVDGYLQGIHAIYLDQLTAYKLLDKGKAKLSYGPIKGGAIRLSPKPVAEHIVLTEGLEDGLSVLSDYPEECVWAIYGHSTEQAPIVY